MQLQELSRTLHLAHILLIAVGVFAVALRITLSLLLLIKKEEKQ